MASARSTRRAKKEPTAESLTETRVARAARANARVPLAVREE